MPTLRQIIDGNTISAAAPMAMKPSPTADKVLNTPTKPKSVSPAAKGVADHLQDPVKSTQDAFGDLAQKKMDYDLTRESTIRQLAPVKSVIQHIEDMHDLNQNGIPDEMENMDDPAAQGTGQPVPRAGMGKSGMSPMQQMNNKRPSKIGFSPGVAPGPAQSVVPNKMNTPSPGNPNRASGGFGPQARPPKGSGKLPGANGPGSTKNKNANKKAQNNAQREIKVHVAASADKLTTSFGLGTLKVGGVKHSASTLLAASDMGENELRDLLSKALKAKLNPGTSVISDSPCGSSQTYGWINEIYPFQNYFIYESGGQKYKQSYKVDGSDVKLVGDGKKVKVAYVNAMARRASGVVLSEGNHIEAGGPGSGRRPGTPTIAKIFRPNAYRGDIRNKEWSDRQKGKTKTPKKATGLNTPLSNFEWKNNWPNRLKGKSVKADIGTTLHEKSTGTGNELALNPVSASKRGGTSHGAKKGWSVRNKGHVSPKEKKAHFDKLDVEKMAAGGPGSGRRPGFGTGRHGGVENAKEKHSDLTREHRQLDSKENKSLRDEDRMDKIERILDDIEQSYPHIFRDSLR